MNEKANGRKVDIEPEIMTGNARDRGWARGARDSLMDELSSMELVTTC